jgi:hypothetical protein
MIRARVLFAAELGGTGTRAVQLLELKTGVYFQILLANNTWNCAATCRFAQVCSAGGLFEHTLLCERCRIRL